MSLSRRSLTAAWPGQTAALQHAAEQSPARDLMSGRGRHLGAGMTATLSAELEGTVARELVADIVQAILDEGRRDGQQLAAESTTHEARQRLQRLIRARSPQ